MLGFFCATTGDNVQQTHTIIIIFLKRCTNWLFNGDISIANYFRIRKRYKRSGSNAMAYLLVFYQQQPFPGGLYLNGHQKVWHKR